jgi:hypothetical protein
MARLHIPLLLCLALLTSAAGATAGTVDERGSMMAVSGVYSVTFNLNILSTLPAGSLITCRARIAPNPGRLDPRNQRLAELPAQAEGRVALTGSTAACTAEIPFAWTVASAQGGVVLSYEIDAVSGSGGGPLVVRSSARQNISAPSPASSGSANLSLNVDL